MAFDEMKAGFELASAKQIARLFGRALLLRCPNCGKGPVRERGIKLRVRCGTCGVRLQRGEHDYFMGSTLFLYVLAGLLVIGTLIVTIIVSWPDIPWTQLQWGVPALMAVSVPLLFLHSKLLWLAFDLALRPVTPEEMEWHQSTEDEFSSVRGYKRRD